MPVNINSAFDNDAKASCVAQITMKMQKSAIYSIALTNLQTTVIIKLPRENQMRKMLNKEINTIKLMYIDIQSN